MMTCTTCHTTIKPRFNNKTRRLGSIPYKVAKGGFIVCSRCYLKTSHWEPPVNQLVRLTTLEHESPSVMQRLRNTTKELGSRVRSWLNQQRGQR